MKKADFEIVSNVGSKHTVSGVVSEYFGVHVVDRKPPFIITHLPTGVRVWDTKTKGDARQLVENLEASNIKWDVTVKTLLSKRKRDQVLSVIKSTLNLP